jgi:hypothetical protein
MAHSLRIVHPVGYCHFMNRSHSRGNIFLDNKCYKRFIDLRSDNSATEDGDSCSREMKKSLIS